MVLKFRSNLIKRGEDQFTNSTRVRSAKEFKPEQFGNHEATNLFTKQTWQALWIDEDHA